MWNFPPALVVSMLALLFSIISFGLSYRLNANSAVNGEKPVLVFEYDAVSGWIIRNVGKGPAMNVLVAKKEPNADWFDPVRVPAIAVGSTFAPKWLGHLNTKGLGILYEDTTGRPYTSVTGNDLTKIETGHRFGPWTEAEIDRHWQQHGD